MILKIKPHSKNEFPIGGVLIKSASPKVWLNEIHAMNLSLDAIQAYAIPSSKANELYGCLVVTNQRLESIGKNNYLQLIDDALFIPEYATITPNIASEEWESLFKGYRFIMLPEIGLFELKELINWGDLMNGVRNINVKITTPANSVFIPNWIKSVRYELSEEDLLKQLENPLSEEEIIEQLPFDMKKLLNGNQRELEKYLTYIEKNPEMAIKLGIPLDTLGTSRGNNWGEFNFGGGFFDNFFGQFNSGRTSNVRSLVTSKAAVILVVVFFLVVFAYTIFSPSSTETNSETHTAAKSAVTAIQDSEPQSKAVLVVFVVIMSVLIVKLIFTSSFSVSKEYNFKSTVILLILLLVALLILLYPIYKNEGFDSKSAIIILIFVGMLLYRVFNSNKSILNNDERK